MTECRRRSRDLASSDNNPPDQQGKELKKEHVGFVGKLINDIKKFYNYQPDQIKWMNERPKQQAYCPTEIEHIANIITHGFWIIPAAYAGFLLFFKSQSQDHVVTSVIYGSALTLLFLVSTAFHCVFYCNKDLMLKDILHRADRAMIYVFISASYFPWLNLGHISHPHIVGILKWLIWALAAIGIIYQQVFHEKYKSLETIFYLLIAIGPATVIILCGHEIVGMPELKIGGLLYLVGVFFFKADGIVSCSHAIWHLFVVLAASVHYFAILKHLYLHDQTTVPSVT